MPLAKVKKFNQVTIPKKLGKELGIQEGDSVEIKREGNRLYIEPVEITQKDLASIWRDKAKDMETVKLSKEGEGMLDEALKEIEHGHFKEFDNVEDLIRDLKQ